MRSARFTLVIAMLAPATTGVALGQDYPVKPIRIVSSPIGGSGDYMARLVAQGISPLLGQNMIIDNRPIGVIQAQIAAGAPPNGHTLLSCSNVLWIEPLMKETPYDAVRDFVPITLTSRSTLVLTVHPSLPIANVKELIAYAKARAGELNYATGASGTASHLAAELFKSTAGVNFVRISYKGSGLATTDLVSGRVQLAFYSPTSVIPHIKTGKLRALGVTGLQPSALLPGLPTIAESIPGYDATSSYAVFAPAKTPAAIVDRLNQAAVQFLRTPEAKEKLVAVGSEPVGSSPRELAEYMKTDIARWAKVIREAGIRGE